MSVRHALTAVALAFAAMQSSGCGAAPTPNFQLQAVRIARVAKPPVADAKPAEKKESDDKDESYGYEFSDDPLRQGGFGPNDATVRARPEPAPEQAGVVVVDEQESVRTVVREHASEVEKCYDAELKRDPNAEGRLMVLVTVVLPGKVGSARVVDSSIESPELKACVLKEVKSWEFAPPKKGELTFSFPYVFMK